VQRHLHGRTGGRDERKRHAPDPVAVVLSHSQLLSLPRSTSTITVCDVGLREPSEAILGQKSMSSERAPASAIAARAAGDAFSNPLIARQVVPVQLGQLLTNAFAGWVASLSNDRCRF
jgi:hypothetical protein